jgi:general secretion pathway protein D
VICCSRVFGSCVAAGLVMSLLPGCAPTTLSGQRPQLPDPFETVQQIDLSPRYPQRIEQEHSSSKPPASESFYGTESANAGNPVNAPGDAPPVQAAPNGDGYELNFENADITAVAKAILGGILGVGYTIDPHVQGTVTISSGRSVPKGELILVLENALRMNGVVLAPDGAGGYRLVPSGDGQGPPVVGTSDSPQGYGISVVPLRYTSAQTIIKLLDSYATKAGVARADVAHNMILVEGTGPERTEAVDAILRFDTDWMRGQSVGIYQLDNATPDAMIKELGNIMQNSEKGLNEGLVTFQPIARLNAVLVVTKKPNLLKEVATCIRRLDKSNNAGASVHVYRLLYADARTIAKVLGDLFGTSSSGLNSAANQIAPGAGTSSTSTLIGNQANSANNGLPNLPATQPGLAGAGGAGTPGIQLGNSGNGVGNPQAVNASVFGGSSGAVEPGAFGGDNNQGQTSVVTPGFRIAADVANNSLVVYADQEHYQIIEQTLARLDRPQLQVAIHATIAEVTLNNDLQFGVEYFLQNNAGSLGFNTLGAAAATAAGAAATQALGAVLPGANILIGSQTNPKVVLNALRTITDVKVLSSPSVVVLDNQPATLLVGDQIPVETGTANVLAATTAASNTIVNSINYINTGVILEVLPRVNANGNVVLAIQQEVSGVENNSSTSSTTSSTTSLTPTVSQRQIKSAVAVASGQTVLLGGLISETQTRTRSGIPVLEEIPVLGNLFSTNDRSTMRTEIIVFIEPEIIRNSSDAAKAAEELRAKLRGSADAAFQPGPSLRSDPRFAQ